MENYFLDEAILASVFEDLEPEGSWLRSADAIRGTLKAVAKDFVAYAAALTTSAHFRERVGSLSIMPKDCVGKTTDQLVQMLTAKLETERRRVQAALSVADVEKHAREVATRIGASLDGDTEEWKQLEAIS